MTQGRSKTEVVTEEPPDGWAANEGSSVIIRDRETGKLFFGSVRIKPVNCGKPNCHKCPHHIYAYAQFRKGSKVTEKYLGVAR